MAIKRIRRKPPRQYYTRSEIRKWIPLFDKGTTLHDIPKPPFYSDLSFDFWNREAGTLVLDERINEDDGAVLGGVVADFDMTSWIDTGVPSNQIEKVEYYGSIEFNAYIQTIGSGSGGAGTGLLFVRSVNDTKIKVTFGAQQTSGIELDDGYHYHILEINGNDLTHTVGENIQTVTKSVINSPTSDTFYIGARNYITNLPIIGQCLYTKITYNGGQVKEWYFNGHTYDSIGGSLASWVGTPKYKSLISTTPTSTLEALDNGYYEDISGNQIINPQYAQTTETLFEGGTMHNIISSFICLNPTGSLDAKFDIVDRINQTAASTDSDYYDSTSRITRSTYHISELNQYTLSTYFAVGDKGKLFMKALTNSIDARLHLDEIFVYGTDKTLNDEISVLTYTNDITKAIDDGAGSYLVDGDGYVILTP